MHVLDNAEGPNWEGLPSYRTGGEAKGGGRANGGFPVIQVTSKRTLERRQGAQDLALVLLGPWAVLIGIYCVSRVVEEIEGMRRAGRKPQGGSWWSARSRYGEPGTPSQGPQPLDRGVVLVPVV